VTSYPKFLHFSEFLFFLFFFGILAKFLKLFPYRYTYRTNLKNSCSIDKTEIRKGVRLKKQTTLHNLLNDAEALSQAIASATDENFISQEQYDAELYSLASELVDALYALTQNN